MLRPALPHWFVAFAKGFGRSSREGTVRCAVCMEAGNPDLGCAVISEMEQRCSREFSQATCATAG